MALLLSLALLFGVTSRAQSPAAELDEYVRGAVERYHFSGAVLVARADRVLLSKGYGLADAENDVPNTPRTKFRIGSLTKQFTAMAILILQERGALGVGDPICRYLPQCPSGWEPIKIEHLLTHTSGLPDASFLEKTELPTTAGGAVEYLSRRPLRFAPGTRFSYGGSNYILLGYIVERASGQPYASFLRENIFRPLGMNDTGYDGGRPTLKGRASGYSLRGDTLLNAAHVEMSVLYAAGGLYSTAEDLYRWEQALETEKLASKKSLATMFTPALGGYGYGWYITRQSGRQLVSHGGWISGFASAVALFPDDRVTAIVLSNVDCAPVNTMARSLAAVALGAKPDATREHRLVKMAPETYDAYEGRYELSSGVVLTVMREGERLMGRAAGYPPVEMLPESETVFFVKELDARVTFVRDAGRVTHLILRWDDRELRAVKLDPGHSPQGK